VQLTSADVEDLVSKFELGPDEDISYSQFLAATLTREQLERARILKQLFSSLDTFEKGYINKDTIRLTF